MVRVTLAFVALLLAAPESAPETKYRLQLEEFRRDDTRPALSDMPSPGPEPKPDEPPAHSLEVEIVPGREFAIKSTHLNESQKLTGVLRLTPDGEHHLRVSYSVAMFEDGRRELRMSKVETEVRIPIDKRVQLGRSLTSATRTNDTGTVEKLSTVSIWATLTKVDLNRN